MFRAERLKEYLMTYQQSNMTERWPQEQFKWEAVKWFQDNWDVNALDFAEMLKRSLAKTQSLLVSQNNFPRGMIVKLAEAAPEEVRAMFRNLFDESRDVWERVEAFKKQADNLLLYS